jgi:DNA-binding CsgD family transcriptional regulator
VLTNSKSLSASARAADHGPLLPATVGVAVELNDPDLQNAVGRLVIGRPELRLAAPAEAAVIVRDGDGPTDADFGLGAKVLRVGGGTGAVGETAVETIEPAVIAAAALLLARGYRIEPEPRRSEHAHPHLSARERQVTALLIDGASNKEIARRLDISVHTAKFHVTAVMDKLGARNRADAVAIALREGPVVL